MSFRMNNQQEKRLIDSWLFRLRDAERCATAVGDHHIIDWVAFTIGETIETMWVTTEACVPATKWRETLGLSWEHNIRTGEGKWVFSDPARTFCEVVGA